MSHVTLDWILDQKKDISGSIGKMNKACIVDGIIVSVLIS